MKMMSKLPYTLFDWTFGSHRRFILLEAGRGKSIACVQALVISDGRVKHTPERLSCHRRFILVALALSWSESNCVGVLLLPGAAVQYRSTPWGHREENPSGATYSTRGHVCEQPRALSTSVGRDRTQIGQLRMRMWWFGEWMDGGGGPLCLGA